MYVAWMDENGECHVSEDKEGKFYQPIASFEQLETALSVARQLNNPPVPQLFSHQNHPLS